MYKIYDVFSSLIVRVRGTYLYIYLIVFQMSHLDGKPTERLICATCVKRLREALDFRRQVLQCEEAFLQMRMYDAKEEGEASPYAFRLVS